MPAAILWSSINSSILGKEFKDSLEKEKNLFLEKNRQEVESLEKDMSGRGGPRRKAKPHLDTDLLCKILVDRKDLVQDMGSYERIGTSSAPDIQGGQKHGPVGGLGKG